MDEVKAFLDTFEECNKREQDAILFMATNPDDTSAEMGERSQGRRTFYFLGRYMKRSCFESLVGISSHRVDRIGAFDQRYADVRKPQQPSQLTASIDAFAMILYNSVAEPLPDRLLHFE